MNKNDRNVLLINPHFQFRFIGLLVFATFLAISIFYLSEIFFFKEMIEKGMSANLPEDHIYFDLISSQKNFMDKVFLITSIVVFLFLLIFGLLLSHRIAGPLHKLNESLEDLAANKKIKKITFRKKDFFRELPDSFNKVVDSYQSSSHQNK